MEHNSTNRNSSPFAENAEGVNPPQSVYRICNLCSTFFGKKRRFFLPKKSRLFCQKSPPPSANAEDLKKLKNIIGSRRIRTWEISLTVHRSTHYSIPPFLITDLRIMYIKKLDYFFKLEKKS